jgi:hypothetical protein
MVTTEGSGTGDGTGCWREGWRDTCAAYLVHAGLQLASTDARNRMLHVLADEWRVRVRRQLDATERAESMARHPAGRGLLDRPERVVHLADRLDAAYRAQRPR